MRRLLVPVVVGVVAIVAAIAFFRGPIALRMLTAGLETRMGGNAAAELKDGLHVMLCGAGGPLPDPLRSGPCVAVVAGKRFFVVDAGSGAARNLASRQFAPGTIEGVFLTHFHSDHIDGLGELAMLRWTAGNNTQPLPLYGPRGVARVAQGFNEAYAQDAQYRFAHHGAAVAPLSGTGLRTVEFATPTAGNPITVLDEGGLVVRALRVDHAPVDPAVGYRFDYKGRSLLITGDTKKAQEVVEQARGVDLLVHEALSDTLVRTMNEVAAKTGQAGLQKITLDILDYHTTPIEAAQVAEEAQVKHLLFYHIVPPLPVPGLASVFLEGVEDAYSGPVTLGQDGTLISLRAGRDSIKVSSR